MFGTRTLCQFNKISRLGNNSVKRTGWFTTPISAKPEISKLTNDNFIKVGNTYYNPRFIKSITINDSLVEMKLHLTHHDNTVIFDDKAVSCFTDFIRKDGVQHKELEEHVDPVNSHKDYVSYKDYMNRHKKS